MKRRSLVVILSVFLFALSSCHDNQDINITEIGTVINYAGAGNCKIVIELDNGKRVQPLHYPEGFTFAHGQRVLIEYVELKSVINSCERGTPCEVNYIEELSCASYINLHFENYDSLARDPVHLHEAFVDGDCLYFKVSYSGGCKEHTIDLARMHPWTAGSSKIPTFEIRHNANNDLCEAWFTKEFRYDLKALKQEGITEFVLTAKLDDGEFYNKIFDLN